MSEEFLCVRCSRAQKTCCQTSEVYVSPGDARRIAGYSGRTDFFYDAPPDNPAYADNDDDPAWRDQVFQADGSRRVLARHPQGDCTFLGDRGCTLPLDIRPLVCRLYPFDYDEHGIKDELSHSCPVHLVRPGWSLLGELDMQIHDARRWRQQLYLEIMDEAQFRALGCPLPGVAGEAKAAATDQV
jgi:uncharacterized protein